MKKYIIDGVDYDPITTSNTNTNIGSRLANNLI